MDRSPPPFFRQGVSADVRLALFALAAIALLVLDARFAALTAARQAIGTALFPLQRALLVPRDLSSGIGLHLTGVRKLAGEVEALREREAANAQLLQQAQQTALENLQLRRLLGMRERVRLAGGTCVIDSEPGSGTRICAILPIEARVTDAVTAR